MANKLYLSAGHSTDPKKDRGAVYFIGNETRVEGLMTWDFTEDLYDTFKQKYPTANIVLDGRTNILKETLSNFRRLVSSKDIAIEFHFNISTNPKAGGVEVIIPINYSNFEDKLATKIVYNFSNIMSIHNRGVKLETETARGKLGWMTLNCETVLVEICFMSSETDMKAYNENKTKLIDNLIDELKNYIKI